MPFNKIFAFYFCVVAFCISQHIGHAQNSIDIVDPYQIKVDAAQQANKADTFYFIYQGTKLNRKLDTLRTYDVFLEERLTPYGIAYMCNGKEVGKDRYYEMRRFWRANGACLPCLLYTYDANDNLKYQAFQYEDCMCGEYKEFYEDGRKKTEGQFRPNTSGNWEADRLNGKCNIRVGKWTYFTPEQNTEKIEIYNDEGKLIDIKYAQSSINPKLNNKNSNDEQQEEADGNEKKSVFKKLKNKIKQQDLEE